MADPPPPPQVCLATSPLRELHLHRCMRADVQQAPQLLLPNADLVSRCSRARTCTHNLGGCQRLCSLTFAHASTWVVTASLLPQR